MLWCADLRKSIVIERMVSSKDHFFVADEIALQPTRDAIDHVVPVKSTLSLMIKQVGSHLFC